MKFGYVVTAGMMILCSHASAQKPDAAHVRAMQIAKVLKREGANPNPHVIAETIREIDKNRKVFFPHGPFTREDFIAIAMTESRFNPRCRGAAGDTGIFQVIGSTPDIKRNTRDAFRVMASKYREHHDRRKAIIGYNGYIVHNGKLRDTYWLAFLKQKSRIARVA